MRDVPARFQAVFRNAGITSKRQLALRASVPVPTVYMLFSNEFQHQALKTAKIIASGCGWTLQQYSDLANILTPKALGSAIDARLKEEGTNPHRFGKIFSQNGNIRHYTSGRSTLGHLRKYHAICSALGITLDQFYEIQFSVGQVDNLVKTDKLIHEASDYVPGDSIASQNLW